MLRLLAYIGKLVGTAVVGPGAVVLGDPGLDAMPTPTTAGQRLAYRLAAVGLPVLLVLALVGLAWPILALVAFGLCVMIIVSRHRAGHG
ncbi:MAG TPA: hypothetical protein VF071_03325 [Candidatus Limnocylindria bacterium]